MQIPATDLLKKLAEINKDDSKDFISKLSTPVEKPSNVGKLLDDISNINSDMSNIRVVDFSRYYDAPAHKANVRLTQDINKNAPIAKNIEKQFKSNDKMPSYKAAQRYVTVNDVVTRVIMEAQTEFNETFRFNINDLAVNNTHSKMSIDRNGHKVNIEILYPNSNGKITLKLSIPNTDAEDILQELSLEDEDYRENFSRHIVSMIDSMIEDLENIEVDSIYDEKYIPSGPIALSGFAPSGEGLGTTMSSDMRKLVDLLALFEANEEDEDDFSVDEGGSPDVFGETDFSISDDVENTLTMGNAMGEGGIDINSDSSSIGLEEPNEPYIMFKDKTDWTLSALDTMQKLVANALASSMQKGSGVILTSDEVLNGTVGIRNDSNADIVSKFLSVYPSLDDYEFPESKLNEIEEKLSVDDGQFDTWLQVKLPELIGQEEVDDALDNSMFADFEPMGGIDDQEQPEQEKAPWEGDDLGGDYGGGDFGGDFGSEEPYTGGEEEEEDAIDAALRIEAENEIGGTELNEFANV